MYLVGQAATTAVKYVAVCRCLFLPAPLDARVTLREVEFIRHVSRFLVIDVYAHLKMGIDLIDIFLLNVAVDVGFGARQMRYVDVQRRANAWGWFGGCENKVLCVR